MDFRLLGPVEVSNGERLVPIGEGRQRAVLTLLLLRHDEPVGSDELIDALWNGRPPPTAAKVLQNHVAQLRRALDDRDARLLQTRGRGYVLCLDGATLDLERFEALVGQGQAALEHGDPGRAHELLCAALALWRGPALADVAYESFAQPEIARLTERRLGALELRIDADIALGRHADIVAELEGLVARHPARERLRGQLMLALYRSGRQSDALQSFRDGRSALLEELGIEPGPDLRALETAILRQDPALAPPGRARAPLAPGRRRRAGKLLAAGGMLLALAAIAAAVRELTSGEDTRSPTGTGQIVGLDPTSGHVQRRFAAGRTPASVAAGAGRIWMVDAESRTLLRVDATSGAVETTATGATPVDVAVGADGLWVMNATLRARTVALGPVAADLLRLDAGTLRQRAAVALPAGDSDLSTSRTNQLAVTADAVWAVTADGAIVRIDPAAGTITATTHGLRAFAIAAGRAGVWALATDGSVAVLDPRTARVRKRLRPSRLLDAITVGDSAAWATSWSDGKLWRMTATAGAVPGSVDVGTGVSDVAATPGAIWVANPVAGSVTAVDPESMRTVHTVALGGAPRSLATDGRTLWVAVTGSGEAPSSTIEGVRPVASSSCEPMIGGRDGRADLLVVSDLPLQGDARWSAIQMAQAIKLDLREHGFRAGRFRIAYQSCDDALPATGGYDDARCAANGRAYAEDRDLVGVIGALNSGCTVEVLPELNRAGGGPIPMISPSNSYVGLTRHADHPGLISQLYPTGRRSFVRIFPADDLQAGALAQFARDRGRRRAFVLDDGNLEYSVPVADGFEAAAGRIGLAVVGRARWRSKAASYDGLARRVKATRADAVLVSGVYSSNAAQVIRDLRPVLGDDVDVLVPEGLAPPAALLDAAGPAARGVFMSIPGIATGHFPGPGARFAARLTRTQPGAQIEQFAVYAAQAAETLRAAIAHSDGSRSSVLARLFATDTRGAMIGDVAFDTRGDIEQGAEAIVRLVGGGTGASVASTDGSVIERVTSLSPALVRRPR
jgi:DNA-binding SARP family transcriptional activator/ABC-type branched-subunit amino acid transport system substrate-binding protein